jgi:hypothetical protein
MELNVTERLMLLNMLPVEANITTLRLLRTLKEDLSFNEEENKSLNFVQDGEQLRWNIEAAETVKDVTIGEIMTVLIAGILTKLNTEEKLTEGHINLYDKFMD